MGELFKGDKEKQNAMKAVIRNLHDGPVVTDVKNESVKAITGATAVRRPKRPWS